MMLVFPFAYGIKFQVNVRTFKSIILQVVDTLCLHVAGQKSEVGWVWRTWVPLPSCAFSWPSEGARRIDHGLLLTGKAQLLPRKDTIAETAAAHY